jgi:hypothetical protein
MFYDSAVSASKGGVVYRDFDSAYSPLFPYLTVIPLWFWDSPKSIILEMVGLELLILWGTLRLTRLSVYYALIYLLLPATFILSVLGGQEAYWSPKHYLYYLFPLSCILHVSDSKFLEAY